MPASRPARNKATGASPHQRQAQRRQAAARTAGGGTRAGNRRPLPKGDALYTPGAGPARRLVERRSAVLLVYLHQMPRWTMPLLIAALFLAGVFVPGVVGAALLVLLAAFLGWLSYLSWPALPGNGRLVRTLTVLAVLGLAVRDLLSH